MKGLEITYSGGNCPLQFEGTIDGVAFYFRARGEHWQMGIGGDVFIEPDWLMRGPWGETKFEAGWMPEHIGQAIVEKCCELWRVAKYDKATSYPENPRNIIERKLREKVAAHDGKPITPSDMKRWLNEIIEEFGQSHPTMVVTLDEKARSITVDMERPMLEQLVSFLIDQKGQEK